MNQLTALKWVPHVLAIATALAHVPAIAAPPEAPPAAKKSDTAAGAQDATSFANCVHRAVEFLRRTQQDNGSYSTQHSPGVTALATTALLRHGISEQDPVVARGLRYLEGFIQDDGGIYQPDSMFDYRNYETSLVMMCFAETKTPRFQQHLQRAVKFVKSVQWGEEQGHGPGSPSYGGAGYGKHKRPDLSNTTFFVEGLKAAGVPAEDEAMQRALVFISRCQNLESEHNTLPFADKVKDGGFYYTGAAGGSSQAGVTPDDGLRSYGSMTYAGLKSMIFAGVKKDDPRVRAAQSWIQKNYTLEHNPGMQKRYDGLYYYYHTFAKALSAVGDTTLRDQQGVQHDWKAELRQELVRRQHKNGSWLNERSARWMENDAPLVTAYALLSLSYCQP